MSRALITEHYFLQTIELQTIKLKDEYRIDSIENRGKQGLVLSATVNAYSKNMVQLDVLMIDAEEGDITKSSGFNMLSRVNVDGRDKIVFYKKRFEHKNVF